MSDVPSISLTETATVKVVPDVGYVTFSIVTNASTSSKAMNDNKEQLNIFYKILEPFELPLTDIQTSNLILSEVFAYKKDKRSRDGYMASNKITIKVRDLENFGTLIDKVTSGMTLHIDNIHFGSSVMKQKVEEARSKAIETIQQKARNIASQFGLNLGKILSITSYGDSNYSPPPLQNNTFAHAACEAGGASLVAGGTLSATATISVNWEI